MNRPDLSLAAFVTALATFGAVACASPSQAKDPHSSVQSTEVAQPHATKDGSKACGGSCGAKSAPETKPASAVQSSEVAPAAPSAKAGGAVSCGATGCSAAKKDDATKKEAAPTAAAASTPATATPAKPAAAAKPPMKKGGCTSCGAGTCCAQK